MRAPSRTLPTMVELNEGVELKEVTFSLFGASAKWVADRSQGEAAWELYVELVTRVAIQELKADEAILREAMNSLYKVIEETRRVLREKGAGVARARKKGALTFAAIAVDVINLYLRPYLTRWHPALLDYEATRAAGVGIREHERKWEHRPEAVAELAQLRDKLVVYARLLAEAANVPEEGLPRDLRG